MSGKTWAAQRYARHARFVSDLGAAVLALLDPRPGERILDLGCGDGALTQRLVAAGALVVGADQSEDMIAAARARGLDAVVVDAHALPYLGEFDAVFSNAALHWMRDHEAVTAGVARALRPGGRYVAECGGFGNVAAIMVALRAVLLRHGVPEPNSLPHYYPSTAGYGAILERHGFVVRSMELIPRPTPLPTGMAGWLEVFADAAFAELPAEVRDAARDEAIALLRPSLCDENGNWIADYTRLRFAADLSA
ncbi:MAG: class I SAM-dependent methyltransferase [Alphaproteobacteria bacterium]